jgi:serine/threonine-protein kinase
MSAPRRLGKYQLVAEVARGGMGVVYLAVAQGPAGFNKLLILKVLQQELADDPAFLEMFFEEARLAARLSHPNIVQTYEVGSEGNHHFIVMDYLSGRSLSRVVRRRHPSFTRAMHLRVLCEALRGLDYAHTLTDYDGKSIGVVHRDVNPQNVFITFDGQVKLVDFGIAKAVDSKLETRTGMLKGKPSYMAPEQLGGEADARIDVFAVGVMLFEAISGKRFWGSRSDLEVLTSLIHGKLPVLSEVAPDAPEALAAICRKAIADDVDERYSTAGAMLADLDAWLAESGDNPTVRQVAKVVTDMFAAEAAETRNAVERSLARLRAGEDPAPTETSLAPLLQEATPSRNTGLEHVPVSESMGTPNGTAAPTIEPPPERRRAWPLLAFVGAAAGVVLIGLLLSRTGGTPEGAGPERVAAATGTAPLPLPASAAPAAEATAAATASAVASAAAPVEATAAPATTAAAVARPAARPGVRRPPTPAAVAPRDDPPPASTCNPPFFYDGNKKVYKPGCI